MALALEYLTLIPTIPFLLAIENRQHWGAWHETTRSSDLQDSLVASYDIEADDFIYMLYSIYSEVSLRVSHLDLDVYPILQFRRDKL